MRIIADLDPDTYERVEDLVETSDYEDLNQFLRVAVRNQISLETEDLEREAGSTQTDPWGYSIPSAVPVDDPFEMSRDDILFFQQYYRFLPLIIVMVEMAQRTAEINGPVRLSKFRSQIEDAVIPVRDGIKSWEEENNIKRKNRKSTGLPKKDVKNPEYSMKRYLDHYVGRIRQRDGRPIAFGNEIGFISYKPLDDEDECLVQLTPEGRDLVELGNPLLESGPNQDTLSSDESVYIVRHIRENLQEEYRFMSEIYDVISETDGETYTKKLDRFREFLITSDGLTDEDPSEDRVRSATAGALSRMVELDILDRGRKRGVYRASRHPDEF